MSFHEMQRHFSNRDVSFILVLEWRTIGVQFSSQQICSLLVAILLIHQSHYRFPKKPDVAYLALVLRLQADSCRL